MQISSFQYILLQIRDLECFPINDPLLHIRIESHAEHGGTLNEHQLNRLVSLPFLVLENNQ